MGNISTPQSYQLKVKIKYFARKKHLEINKLHNMSNRKGGGFKYLL